MKILLLFVASLAYSQCASLSGTLTGTGASATITNTGPTQQCTTWTVAIVTNPPVYSYTANLQGNFGSGFSNIGSTCNTLAACNITYNGAFPNTLQLNVSAFSGGVQGLINYSISGSGSVMSGAGASSSIGPSAEAYNSSTQTIASSTNTALTFNTNSWDTGSIHNTSVNPTRFVAPTNGFYLAVVSVLANASNLSIVLFFNVNGSAPTPQGGNNGTNNGTFNTFCMYSQILKLNAGDYVEGFTASPQGYTSTANQSMMSLTKLSTTF